MSLTMRKTFFTILFIGLGLHFTTANAENTPGISVSATGHSHAMPDIARFSVTFQQTSEEVRVAQEKVDIHVKNLMQKLANYELEQDSIDTSYTRVNPIYSYNDGERIPQGFEVSRSVQFATKNLDQIQAVVTTLAASKVSRLEAINFDLEDQSAARAEALKDAINRSKIAANQLAQGYGIELGTIHSIEHAVEEIRHPAPMQARALMMESAPKADSSYQIKALKFNARVAVTFSINH
jgi:uncharacterized protein YggE